MVRALRRQASRSFSRAYWGLKLASTPRAARVERGWRWPLLLALVVTVPAFYAELLDAAGPVSAALAYLAAAAATAAALAHTAWRSPEPMKHVRRNPTDLLLSAGLLLAALLPASQGSVAALSVRLGVSLLVLLRMVWSLQALLTRGSLAYLLLLALVVLGLCGAGFWWLEPTVNTFGEGLWLAFTTAATVGYGDMLPTVPASRIFAVFVVLLGFAVLSTVTAAIATAWIETEERRMEREIMNDLRSQIGSLRAQIGSLTAQIEALSEQSRGANRPAEPVQPAQAAQPAGRARGPAGS